MIEHLLNSTLTVYRATYASDGAGGRTKTFASQGTVRGMPLGESQAVAGRTAGTSRPVVHMGAGRLHGGELF